MVTKVDGACKAQIYKKVGGVYRARKFRLCKFRSCTPSLADTTQDVMHRMYLASSLPRASGTKRENLQYGVASTDTINLFLCPTIQYATFCEWESYLVDIRYTQNKTKNRLQFAFTSHSFSLGHPTTLAPVHKSLILYLKREGALLLYFYNLNVCSGCNLNCHQSHFNGSFTSPVYLLLLLLELHTTWDLQKSCYLLK